MTAPNLKSLHFSVKNPSIALAFRVPEIDHPDIAALEVLSAILGMGESARLHQKLFYEKQICTEVGASVYVPKDPGMFILNADIEATEKADEFLSALDLEIAAVKEHLTEPHELERVITNIESEKLYSTQTVDGVAGRLGFLRFNIGNLALRRRIS
jgi:zinc protease